MAAGAGSTSSAAATTTMAAAIVATGIGGYLAWRRHRTSSLLPSRQESADDGTEAARDVGPAEAKEAASATDDQHAADDDDDDDDAFVRDEHGIPASFTTTTPSSNPNDEQEERDLRPIQSAGTVTVAYASTTGTCRSLAEDLGSYLETAAALQLAGSKKPASSTTSSSSSSRNGNGNSSNTRVVQICRVDELDWWDEVLNPPDDDDDDADQQDSDSSSPPPAVLFVLPTWTDGTLPPASQAALTDALRDINTDWRVAPHPLRKSSMTLRVAAFGIGSSAYDPATYCKPASDVVELLCDTLGGRRLTTTGNGRKKGGGGGVGMGDVESGDYRHEFRDWMESVGEALLKSGYGESATATATACNTGKGDACCGGGGGKLGRISEEEEQQVGCCGGGEAEDGACGCKSEQVNATENDDGDGEDDYDEDDDSYYSDDDDDEEENQEPSIIDLEDMGEAMRESSAKSGNKTRGPPKEMVTPKQAAALKKEGYRLIGTHSAVKLCRWTKHQLRGRGGCYKHTFYGITSYQCMEATPSLACANKCVFCWRHHKNPVGREWRWKTDDPKFIVDEGVQAHVQMIKETKGIPGVRMDRWKEAHTVRHCALSLVGEPIMYPRINEFLGELHGRHISTFLVTNGQHPDAIEQLRPITQLYVSVDAPTPESLEAIDRPLFRDAWDRLRRSLRSLKDKGQRTVARLTVVKGWNSDEVEGYAELIALGHCSLVEMKGVTFCGKSDASNLNMSNSPWHHEVVDLATQLRDELNRLHEAGGDDAPPRYEFACEHRHSVSVLLARVDQFAYDDPVTGERRWKTWIDYDKFQELATRAAADPTFAFGVEDYTAETPSWALFGANEEGFDPTDTRHRKKKKHPKYTHFDKNGVPTHDDAGNVIPEKERMKLRAMMDQKIKEVGAGSTVTALTSGEKLISDPSLMFRGKTIVK